MRLDDGKGEGTPCSAGPVPIPVPGSAGPVPVPGEIPRALLLGNVGDGEYIDPAGPGLKC